MSAPNSAAASILANIERARVAMAVINREIEACAEVARVGAATWSLAGNAGKVAQDLEDLAQFLAPEGGF